MTHPTEIVTDLTNKKLNITREFSAPVDKVWKAWTDSALLDKWWAPKPWRAETKTMDFTEGGKWLYCMVGPNGEISWSRVDFITIVPQTSFTAESSFRNEEENRVDNFPVMLWNNRFIPTASGSKMEITITFDEVANLEKIIQMGFKEGFTMGLGNLDELLAAGFSG